MYRLLTSCGPPYWLVIGTALVLMIAAVAHAALRKPQQFMQYCAILLFACCAKSLGSVAALSQAGLNASFWAIVMGGSVAAVAPLLGSQDFLKTGLGSEFFIKLGVVLLATPLSEIGNVGARGLLVAWLDTVLVIVVGMAVAAWAGVARPVAMVVVGATAVCGSSAATALATAVGLDKAAGPLADAGTTSVNGKPSAGKSEDKTAASTIAVMAVANVPLIATLPMFALHNLLPDEVVGAWIGGAIDSTGPVIASATLGGPDVLRVATVIKMLQNLIIGPLCLLASAWAAVPVRRALTHTEGEAGTSLSCTASCSRILATLASRFPRFVLGFLITSFVAYLLPHEQQLVTTNNSFIMSEWFSLIGFVCMGLEINWRHLASNRAVWGLYAGVQALDLATTLGWAVLAFSVLK
mgnify:CR=1 FL=1